MISLIAFIYAFAFWDLNTLALLQANTHTHTHKWNVKGCTAYNNSTGTSLGG